MAADGTLKAAYSQEHPALRLSLAKQGALALLVPITLIGGIGTGASGADYGRGADAQLNRLGVQLVLLAFVAACAVVLSAWLPMPRWSRVTLGAFAVALTIVGLVWGLPAEARGRTVAHNCACEGG